MSDLLDNIASNPGKTLLVEIVGPAGAGKTSLCQELDCCNEIIQLQNFPDVRKMADAPFFILNGLKLIPSLFRLDRSDSRGLTRREFAWLSILLGWPSLLRKETNGNNRVIILDQGPIYLLAEMRLFGPPYLKQKAAEGFWQDLYDRWRTILHMVIWLDASNDVLLDRIRNREQDHIVKTQPQTIVYDFLDRYRAEYEFLLSILTAHQADLKVIQYDTGRQSIQDIENQFLSGLKP